MGILQPQQYQQWLRNRGYLFVEYSIILPPNRKRTEKAWGSLRILHHARPKGNPYDPVMNDTHRTARAWRQATVVGAMSQPPCNGGIVMRRN